MKRNGMTALLAACVLGLAVVAAHAADRPGRGVTELMPAGALAVVRMADGAGFLDAVRDSRFASQFQKTALWKQMQSADDPASRKRREKDAEVRKQFGVGGLELMRAVAGKDWGLAMYAAKGGKPQFLMAARATDPSLLATAVVRLTAEAQKKGEGKFVQFSHAGVSIVGREGGPHSGYLFLHGDAVAVTGSKELIEKAAELAAGTGGKSVAADPDYQAALKLLQPGSTGSLYVRPAAIAGQVGHDRKDEPTQKDAPLAPREAARRQMLEFVRSLDTVVGGLRQNADGASVELVVKLASQHAAPLVDALTAVPGPLKSLQMVGPNTVFYAGAKVDAAAAYEAIRKQVVAYPLAERHVKAMELLAGATLGGVDFRTQVLPALGPEVAMFVARPDAKEARYPLKVPQLAYLVEVKDDVKLRTSIGNLLRLGGATLTLGANQGGAKQLLDAASETYKGVDIFTVKATEQLGAQLPKKLQKTGVELQVAPSFAFVDGFLVVASHPAVIRQLVDAKGGKVPANLAALIPPAVRQPNAVCVLDVENLAGWMADNLAAVKALADKPQDVQGYQALLEALKLVKGLAAARSRTDNTVHGAIEVKVIR